MSYLDSPRLHFRGWFQADVSTINNDVRFYQNASFVPEYQQLNQNGSWNPEGTGVFRLLDCTATGAVWNGNQADVSGITIQNALQRAPGKLNQTTRLWDSQAVFRRKRRSVDDTANS